MKRGRLSVGVVTTKLSQTLVVDLVNLADARDLGKTLKRMDIGQLLEIQRLGNIHGWQQSFDLVERGKGLESNDLGKRAKQYRLMDIGNRGKGHWSLDIGKRGKEYRLMDIGNRVELDGRGMMGKRVRSMDDGPLTSLSYLAPPGPTPSLPLLGPPGPLESRPSVVQTHTRRLSRI